MGLQLSMAALVYSLIEENGPRELAIAKVFNAVILCWSLSDCDVDSLCVGSLSVFRYLVPLNRR